MQEIPVQRGDNLGLWEITLYFERREYIYDDNSVMTHYIQYYTSMMTTV